MTWLLNKPAYQVQKVALDRSANRPGFLFLLEQGLGKTAITYADYLRIRNAGHVDGLVVLCPNSLKTVWVDEAESWGTGIHMAMWPLNKYKDLLQQVKEGLVINYEAMTGPHKSFGSGGEFLLKLITSRRIMLILDESHRIKTPDSTVSRFVISHAIKECKYRRGNTGTPYGNSVLDLYPQLRLAGALNGINPITFRNTFALVGGFKGKQVIGIREESKEELEGLLNQYGFRALKSEWTDIPEKVYQTRRVDLPKKVEAAYKEMAEDFVLMLDDEAITANMIITQLGKLQQISTGFIRNDSGENIEICPIRELPKYKALLEIIEANGQTAKTLVFAYNSYVVAALKKALFEDLGVPPSFIEGGMDPADVRRQKESFNSDAGSSVMVLQITAGREGHTLLGGPNRPCHTTAFFQNTYNNIHRMQAEDRNHRIGQTHSVLINDFVSSPIEGDIVRSLQTKKDVATELLDSRRLARRS